MIPDSGSPSALPMPSVALMRATAETTFSRGSSSRMMLMPTGIRDAARPWKARPTRSVSNVPPTAAMMDPTTMVTMATTIMRRLPNMSAIRETMGVAMALVSSVMVTSQEVLSGEAFRIFGKSGNSGTTMVCCSATTVPARHRIVMTREVRFGAATVRL